MVELTAHVIDDDDDARRSLAFLLASADVDARTYASAAAFLEGAATARGVVITDIRMPDMDGLALIRRMAELGISLPVIVMTGHGDVPLAVEAMKAGVIEFLEKPFDDEAMLAAVQSALAISGMSAEREGERADYSSRIAALSPRERQVLTGLVDGKANKVIAYDLGISPRTVEIYRAHVMTKMGARSLSELVRMSLLAGS